MKQNQVIPSAQGIWQTYSCQVYSFSTKMIFHSFRKTFRSQHPFKRNLVRKTHLPSSWLTTRSSVPQRLPTRCDVNSSAEQFWGRCSGKRLCYCLFLWCWNPPPGVSANSLCSSLTPYRRKLFEAPSPGDTQVLIWNLWSKRRCDSCIYLLGTI